MGAGELPEQLRPPAILLPSISGLLVVSVPRGAPDVPVTAMPPLTRLSPSSTPPELFEIVTLPSTVFCSHTGLPSSALSPTSTKPVVADTDRFPEIFEPQTVTHAAPEAVRLPPICPPDWELTAPPALTLTEPPTVPPRISSSPPLFTLMFPLRSEEHT